MKEAPPLLGEIAYVWHYCVKHPIIFTEKGWRFCALPDMIDPRLIIRDDVCKNTYWDKNTPNDLNNPPGALVTIEPIST